MDHQPTPPRDVPSWDEYFLSLARQAATRSKDPNTQHGAVVVDPYKRVLSTGYNGGCRRIPDRCVDWSRPNKYAFVIHAEENALWHAQRLDLDGCTLYVTGPPCSRCMLRIAHVGISRVVYGTTQSVSVDSVDWELAQQIAQLAEVKLCPHAVLTTPPDKPRLVSTAT
jgi:dCMP deaminase